MAVRHPQWLEEGSKFASRPLYWVKLLKKRSEIAHKSLSTNAFRAEESHWLYEILKTCTSQPITNTTTTTDIASSLNLFTDLEPGVDGDAAAVVLLDAELLEAQISGVGTSAYAHQQHVRVELKKEQD